jgi:hypothetical protein
MKLYETNAGLGYGQVAYLIRVGKSKSSNIGPTYDYMCIAVEGIDPSDNDMYELGTTIESLESFYVQPSDFKIEDSPLYNPLFSMFLENYERDLELAFEAGKDSQRQSIDGDISEGIIGQDGPDFHEWRSNKVCRI